MRMPNPLKAMTEKIRGCTCEFCGRPAKPIPGTGKKRYRHKCPHGQWCAKGEGLNAMHANWPDCPDCYKAYRAQFPM